MTTLLLTWGGVVAGFLLGWASARLDAPRDDDSDEIISRQLSTIAEQRQHIRDLDARIDKLEAEAGGLRSLI